MDVQVATDGPAGADAFDALSDLLPDQFWVCDGAGTLLRVNRRMSDYFARHLAGELLHDLVAPEDADAFVQAWRAGGREDGGLRMEVRLAASDGSHRWFLVRAVRRVCADRGELWFGTNGDIDDQRRVHADLVRSVRAQNRTLATADHDLRQPLAGMLFLIDGLRRRVTEAGDLQLLQAIGNAVHGMKLTVDNQVDFARLAAGTLRAQMRDIPVNPVLMRLAIEFAPLARARGLTLSVQPCSVLVRSDPQLLERMLRNLLFNALRYTRDGRIAFGCRRRGDRLRIEVHDTGRGIDDGERAHLGEPFYRSARSIGEHPGGLGLGLAVVVGLARLMGHDFGFRSILSRGSAFHVEVPVSEPELLRKAACRPTGALAGLGVLILPGDEALPAGLEEAFGRIERHCDEASAIAAITRAGKPPDLVLCGLVHRGVADGVLRLRRLLAGAGDRARGVLLCTDPQPVRLREIQLAGFSCVIVSASADEMLSRLLEVLFRHG